MAKRTNFDIIKTMNKEELAATFYMFIKPFMDGFELSEEQKNDMRKSIMDFLNSECGVKKNGD